MGNSSKFQSSAVSSSSSQSHVSTSNHFQPAPKGRPRGPRHAGDSGSASSETRSEQSIQSSPPIGSSLPIDSSSATFVPPPPQTEESSASMNEPSLQSSQPIGVSLPIGSSATLLRLPHHLASTSSCVVAGSSRWLPSSIWRRSSSVSTWSALRLGERDAVAKRVMSAKICL